MDDDNKRGQAFNIITLDVQNVFTCARTAHTETERHAPQVEYMAKTKAHRVVCYLKNFPIP